MFSAKRITKVFLSVLCTLCCTCGFSFVSAKRGDIIKLSDYDLTTHKAKRIIFVAKEVGIGEWAMIKNEGRGKKVPTRVKFVRLEGNRIRACEKSGLQREWLIRWNEYTDTGDLIEIDSRGRSRVIQTLVRHLVDESDAKLKLTDSLWMTGSHYGYCGVELNGEYKYDFNGQLDDCPEKVKILMACFLPKGPLSHVSGTWTDCGVPV